MTLFKEISRIHNNGERLKQERMDDEGYSPTLRASPILLIQETYDGKKEKYFVKLKLRSGTL